MCGCVCSRVWGWTGEQLLLSPAAKFQISRHFKLPLGTRLEWSTRAGGIKAADFPASAQSCHLQIPKWASSTVRCAIRSASKRSTTRITWMVSRIRRKWRSAMCTTASCATSTATKRNTTRPTWMVPDIGMDRKVTIAKCAMCTAIRLSSSTITWTGSATRITWKRPSKLSFQLPTLRPKTALYR